LNITGKTIVIADDDTDDIELFESALKCNCESYSFHAVKNGHELFRLLDFLPVPDLIVLDINMPKMSGVDCLQKLKSDTNTASIPVVMFSTASLFNCQQEYIQLGAASFLTKPYCYDELVSMVGKICAEFLD
jgi:CheY-like chemotaxis protein